MMLPPSRPKRSSRSRGVNTSTCSTEASRFGAYTATASMIFLAHASRVFWVFGVSNGMYCVNASIMCLPGGAIPSG